MVDAVAVVATWLRAYGLDGGVTGNRDDLPVRRRVSFGVHESHKLSVRSKSKPTSLGVKADDARLELCAVRPRSKRVGSIVDGTIITLTHPQCAVVL